MSNQQADLIREMGNKLDAGEITESEYNAWVKAEMAAELQRLVEQATPEGLARCRAVASEQAAEMQGKLEAATPSELGWPELTAEELVESEWRCWFEEEVRLGPPS